MRRLVFVTQQVDPAHPALAATVPKIAALARRLDEVAVLADGAVVGALPENCRVSTFGGGSKAGRGARFAAALSRELRPRPIAVVAHMAPVFAVLAAPLARPRGVPVLLWFTHWRASPTLRLAARLSSRIVSVDRRSFPLDSGKVRPIGHGIDLSEFSCAARDGSGVRLRAVALGRYSPAKGLDVILRAVAQAPGVELEVRGPALNHLERSHRAELDALVSELGLSDRVRLGDALPRAEVPALLGSKDVLVNNMRAGAPDKVVYEAAATCLPVLASNPVFDSLLPEDWRFPRDDAAALAGRLHEVAALGAEERSRRTHELRDRVEREHSVDAWAERLIAVAEEAAR
jgi:glycosyltransferase involved in cell wall biosynthesis